MSDLLVRALAAQDEPRWRELWTGYLEYYESTVSEAVYKETFRRLLTEDDSLPRALVAERDGVLVGLVHYILHPHCWRVERVCYLQDLYADPQVRGEGVGRALIEAVYAAADAVGAPSVYWLTQDFNTTARQLYDRIGTVTPFIKYQRPL
ncbi:MAG: GNAT family N-acetyltransferase [Pseudomonadota bacterium]